jgi:hypothetical protein
VTEARGEFENPEERENPQLEIVTRRLVGRSSCCVVCECTPHH